MILAIVHSVWVSKLVEWNMHPVGGDEYFKVWLILQPLSQSDIYKHVFFLQLTRSITEVKTVQINFKF